MVNEDGDWNVFYLNNDGKRWNLNWNYLSNDVNSNERTAFSGNWQGI
ncbi:MAG: hypothetical protein KGI73_04785 [Patescibacteria group bacterium]|nr:hypothetical protein [Patescibacteria group bacterium]